jgi:hypothetical protein
LQQFVPAFGQNVPKELLLSGDRDKIFADAHPFINLQLDAEIARARGAPAA